MHKLPRRISVEYVSLNTVCSRHINAYLHLSSRVDNKLRHILTKSYDDLYKVNQIDITLYNDKKHIHALPARETCW